MGDRRPPPGLQGLDAWVQLAASIGIGFAIGWWLDRHFGLEPPWCTVAFVALGTVAGMRTIFEMARRMEAEDRHSPFRDTLPDEDSEPREERDRE